MDKWFNEEKENTTPELPPVAVVKKDMRAILVEKIENIIDNGGNGVVTGVNVSDFSFVHGKYRRSHRHIVNITLDGDVVNIINLVNDGKKNTEL